MATPVRAGGRTPLAELRGANPDPSSTPNGDAGRGHDPGAGARRSRRRAGARPWPDDPRRRPTPHPRRRRWPPSGPRWPASRPTGRAHPTSATAVVYRSDGYLLTTEDAVADVTDPTVTLSDGRTLPATVVGSDPVSGIAVVKVDADELAVAALGGEGAGASRRRRPRRGPRHQRDDAVDGHGRDHRNRLAAHRGGPHPPRPHPNRAGRADGRVRGPAVLRDGHPARADPARRARYRPSRPNPIRRWPR